MNNSKKIIGTELLSGQGLGNQLFCYITIRCIAKELGYDFCILGSHTLANNIHSSCGLYFMDLDFGEELKNEDFEKVLYEKEDRLYLGNSKHDLTHGAYVTGTDESLLHSVPNVLWYGNMQSEAYFAKYKEDIKEWLKVKPEYDCMDYSKDNLCILHLRCSDYMDSPELFLQKKYWINGMKHMKKVNPQMEFMIITNDVKTAEKFLPGIPAFNFDLAKDYSIIKNAKYLLLANSSFTYFPAFTSDTVRYILAPKYWARHNVSDGYWASEQNIYDGWHYMDRRGKVFSSNECKKELEEYKQKSTTYKKINKKPSGISLQIGLLHAKWFRFRWMLLRACRSLKRRLSTLLSKNR